MRKLNPVPGSTIFDIPVYGGRVVLCTRREAFQEMHRRIDGDEYAHVQSVLGVTARLRDRANTTVYLVGVFENGEQTLVHEVVHLVFWVLSHAGVPINRKNDEAFAYLMDALFAEAKAGIRKIRTRKGK